MKNFLTAVVSLICVFALASCVGDKNKTKSEPESSTTVSQSAIDKVKGSNLTKEKMEETLTAFAEDVLSSLLAKDNVEVVAVIDKEGVSLNSITTLDTGDKITKEGLFAFPTVEDAYAYFYENGQFDLNGKLLVDVEAAADESEKTNVPKVETEPETVETEEKTVKQEGLSDK